MKRLSNYVIIFSGLLCLLFDFHNRWKGDWWKSDINADGYGYYAYLPCVFIYHNFDYYRVVKEEKKIRPEISDFEASYSFPNAENGKQTDRCFVGEAVLLAPFFLLAYLLSYLTGYDLNGYSLLFQLAVSVAALFYLILGLLFTRKLLKEYFFSELTISATLLLLVAGTNLLYYSTIQPSMSHVYSFCCIAAFLAYAKTCVNTFNFKNALGMFIAFGFVVLLRPVNLLCLAIVPFLTNEKEALFAFVKKVFSPKHFLVPFVMALGIISVQFIVWKLQTGNFFYWSYKGEKFYFSRPHLLGTLFSYRCGWFLYTPVMLLSITGGLLIELRKSLFRFIAFLAFFLLVSYILSSWYSWFYVGFGLRTFIDYYAAFAIMLAIVLHHSVKKPLRVAISLVLIFLIYLNITQTRQYTNFIIDNRYMDKERYWKVFLKTGSNYVNLFAAKAPPGINFYTNYRYRSDFENNSWGNDSSITDENSMLTRHCAHIGNSVKTSPVLKLTQEQIPKDAGYIYTTLWAYMNDTNNDAALVVSIKTETDSTYFYSATPIKRQIHNTGTWQEISALVKLPGFKTNKDIITVYEYATKGNTYIDGVDVCFGKIK